MYNIQIKLQNAACTATLMTALRCIIHLGRCFVYYRKNLNSILKYQKIGATIVLVIKLASAAMVYSVDF